MIGQWFLDKVKELTDAHHRLVITDTQGDGAFLLAYLPARRYIVLTASKPSEERRVRTEAERDYREKNVIFYTTIPQKKLSALQEYAATCGCIVLDDMEAYIKRTLHEELGLHTQVDGRTLLLAAKMSKGRDENWWRGIATGINNPLQPTRLITEFLKSPETFAQESDSDVYVVMQEETCKIAGKPKTNQTPEILAAEFMASLFSKLLDGTADSELLDIYYAMADSEEMKEQLQAYIDDFKFPSTGWNPYTCHADHPFAAIDKEMFRHLAVKLKQHEDITDDRRYIAHRLASKKALRYKPAWLKEVGLLLDFNIGQPHLINSLPQLAEYYRDTFAPLDTSMRRIYVEWQNEPDVLRPVQEYYEMQNKLMLDAWFGLTDHYEQTQQGLLKKMFDQGRNKTAVIVCDGLRLEMAEAIARRKFHSGISIGKTTAWSKLPSVTPNGMSALYGLPSAVGESTAKRQAALKQDVPDVEIMPLDKLNNSVTASKLVLTYGNIDEIGETLQMAGLAEISGYEEKLYASIQQLLRMGYNDVFLTTDHGYVITGILDEADKVPAPAGASIDERFAVSTDPLQCGLIERNDVWTSGSYQYYARTDKPFRTKGKYGYAHGGMTPQECLIPTYHFAEKNIKMGLKVSISNKTELNAVTGQFYTIKLAGTGDMNNMFESERKVQLLFYREDGSEDSKSSIINIKADAVLDFENTMNASQLKVVVIDARTTEQLDVCVIKKSVSRDIDDLF